MPELTTMQRQIDDFRGKVEINSRFIDEICYQALTPHTKDLDELLRKVRQVLSEEDSVITTTEYENIAIKIPIYLYNLTTEQEKLGIRADISKAFEKEKFSNVALSIEGTAKEREYMASNETQSEAVVSSAMNRAYKMIQQKINIALELLAVIKKILQKRFDDNRLPE